MKIIGSDSPTKGASRYDVHIGGRRGGLGKADIVREVTCILEQKSVPNADKEGGGQKIPKFCGCHQWKLPFYGEILLYCTQGFATTQVVCFLVSPPPLHSNMGPSLCSVYCHCIVDVFCVHAWETCTATVMYCEAMSLGVCISISSM